MLQVALPIQTYGVEPVASSCPHVTIRTATLWPPEIMSAARENFRTRLTSAPASESRATPRSDLINFARMVKIGKHYSSFNRLRASCMGKHRKVYSGRSETSRGWQVPSSLL